MTLLEINNIEKWFGGVHVLKDLSLILDRGTIMALLGTSGSGKTTLARLICGSLKPDSGLIMFDGKIIMGIDKNRPLSMMPQESGYWSSLTVKDQLALTLKSKRARFFDGATVESIAEMGGLRDQLFSYANELSGGEMRRLAFLRAISVNCDLLILDEPFTSVDEYTEAKMQVLLRQYVDETKCAVLMITHEFDHAALLAHRAAILHDGRIVQNDKPDVLLRRPSHSAVVQVLGEINVWPVRTISGESKSVITTVGSFQYSDESSAHNNQGHAVYYVPTDSVTLGEGSPGICGFVDSVIPCRKGLRLSLRSQDNQENIDIALPLRKEFFDSVRINNRICLKWAINEAMILNG